MRQVLFRIPFPWMQDGLPLYGYGLMLFLAFVACTLLASRRARQAGINPEHIHDLALYILGGGILGARIVFYIQYPDEFSSIWDFFAIWNGGLVFYGGLFGAVAAYGIAYFRIVKKNNLSGWKLVDVMAPCAALGLCLGRIGCLLNGCCFGDVACPDCYGVSFPLSGMPRAKLVGQGWQTPTGFLIGDIDDHNDPRTTVGVVENDSAAARDGGLLPGDRILRFNGGPNKIIVVLEGQDNVALLAKTLQERGREVEVKDLGSGKKLARISYTDPKDYQADYADVAMALPEGRRVFDTFRERVFLDPLRGENELALSVERDGQPIDLKPFTPRGIRLYPTQLYETISMGLLTVFLLLYTPFRRHDGEVFALFWILYPLHRFLNEMLRNDTDPVAFGLTLSQNGSIIVFCVGVVMLLLLRRMPAPRPRPA